jgi:hypothetical protein
MDQFYESVSVDQNGDLYFQGNIKIAIVYYRSGYTTREKISWEAIEKANLSNAINIPSIHAFLVNTKTMQALLSKREIMRKYLSEK